MRNDGYEPTPDTRVRIASTVIDTMLLRASRIVNDAETRSGRVAIMLADTFRMNLMAVLAALGGETRAEYLAVDDQGAADIAEILHEARGQATLTVPTALIEQARQLYGTAALAGKDVEAHDNDPDTYHVELRRSQYQAVAAAAMMLGEILSRVAKVENGESDAG